MSASTLPCARGVVVRKLVLTFVGVFLFAAGLTLLFDGMRAVMEVGGSCGAADPTRSASPAPTASA